MGLLNQLKSSSSKTASSSTANPNANNRPPPKIITTSNSLQSIIDIDQPADHFISKIESPSIDSDHISNRNNNHQTEDQRRQDSDQQSIINHRDYQLEQQLLASHPPPKHHPSNKLLHVKSSDNIFKRVIDGHGRSRSTSEINPSKLLSAYSSHQNSPVNNSTMLNNNHSGSNNNFSNSHNNSRIGIDSPPPPSLRSGLPPTSFKDTAVLYQVVAERRNAFDNLLWQVPATSLTAHAFLFSISLAADTGRFARIASMGLCIVITVLTLHLFTRQLQAEDADHRWLTDFEERHQIDYYDRAHGARWKDYRAQKPAGAGWLGWLAMHRSYPLWSKGMIIIGVVAFTILILAIFHPNALIGYNCQI